MIQSREAINFVRVECPKCKRRWPDAVPPTILRSKCPRCHEEIVVKVDKNA